MSEENKLAVLPPPLSVTEQEAAQIFEDLGLVSLRRDEGEQTAKAGGLDIIKQLRLGAFGDDLGAVRLDRGWIMVAQRVVGNHLLRLNQKANEAQTVEELKSLAYPMGYLAGAMSKAAAIGIKAKTIVEEVDAEKRKPRSESWAPGQILEAQTTTKSVAS